MYQLDAEFSGPAETSLARLEAPVDLPMDAIPGTRIAQDFGPVGRFMIASLVSGIVWVGPLAILVFLSW